MKGKKGRPRIPLSGISDRHPGGLSAPGAKSPNSDKILPPGMPEGMLARGGAAKKRADKKPRSGKWMQDAVKPSHKGLFTEKAHKAGKSVSEYAKEKAHAPGKLGKEARLAKTFQKMAKK